MVTAASSSPEFLYLSNQPDGRNPVAAVDSATGALIGPDAIAGARRAAPGDVVTLFATGFGSTTPNLAAGEVPSGPGRVTEPVIVRLGGRTLSPDEVPYVGVVPFSVIYQVNLRIPAGVTGDAPLVISIGGQESPSGAFLALRP
jgi:uncharacterized protein (TIGR03437 family)